MKRSPEKVSGRCARISIYIYLSLSSAFLLSCFEIVSRRCAEAPGLKASKVETSRVLCVSFLRTQRGGSFPFRCSNLSLDFSSGKGGETETSVLGKLS